MGTISYVGFIERMALGSHAKKIGGKETLKVDFEKYIAGYDNYIKTKEINRLNNHCYYIGDYRLL